MQQYHGQYQEFPHEGTADQFFDEAQWESYRSLGEHIAATLVEHGPWFWNIPLPGSPCERLRTSVLSRCGGARRCCWRRYRCGRRITPIRWIIWNRKPLEGGITDLFFFPRTDEQGVRRMELILCVRRALTEAGSLILEPYTYTIYMDLNSTVTFDNDEQLKRYGGTVVRPDNITPTVTIRSG